MKSRILFSTALCFAFSLLLEAGAFRQEKQMLQPQQANQAQQQKSQEHGVSAPLARVNRAWKPTRILLDTTLDAIEPKDRHVFLAIEVRLEAEDIIECEVEFEELPTGAWLPRGVICRGDRGGEIHSQEAAVTDSSGGKYLPVATFCQGLAVLYKQFGDRKADSYPFSGADMETPDGAPAPGRHRVVFVYETPVARRGFKFKPADSEPLPIEVKTDEPPR